MKLEKKNLSFSWNQLHLVHETGKEENKIKK